MIDDATTPSPESLQTVPRTRRALLTGVAGSLAGLFIARLGVADPVAAAAGDPLLLGAANTAGSSNTTLAATSSGTALQVTQSGTGTALRGSAIGPNSIAGFFTATNGTGISGVTGRNSSHGTYGGNDAPTFGGGAAIRASGQQNHGLVASASGSQADGVQAVHTGNGTAVRATASAGVAMQAVGLTGVTAEATGSSARGVFGLASGGGTSAGVRGESYSPAGRGVHGVANVGDASDTPIGVLGETTTPDGFAVQGVATAGGTGVRGDSPAFIGVRGTGATGVDGIGGTVGVNGQVHSASAADVGVKGYSQSSAGTGVQGIADSATGAGVGVLGTSVSPSGTGVKGIAQRVNGATTGVHGEATSTTGVGVKALATSLTGGTEGLHAAVASPDGIGVHAVSSATTGNTAAVFAATASTAGTGVYGLATATTGQSFGVVGDTNTVPPDGSLAAGVWGHSGASTGGAVGVFGQTQSTDPDSAGVLGWAFTDTGTAAGVTGITSSGDGIGVSGLASQSPGICVFGSGIGNGYGIYSEGRAKVTGTLDVTGTVTKGGGSFKIDHPLDPANKFLSHSFVESPDMKNIYDGVVKLDGDGVATVELPDWFEALNRDVRYQLTPIGEYAPLFIRSKMKAGSFTIGGGVAGQEVSWQVTGIRQDAWAEAHRIPVEEKKTGEVKGRYLHPKEHGKDASKGIKSPVAARRSIAKAPKAPTPPA